MTKDNKVIKVIGEILGSTISILLLGVWAPVIVLGFIVGKLTKKN